MDKDLVLDELQSNLNSMDLPFEKKVINKRGLAWLLKNLYRKNDAHPKYRRTIELVNICIKNRWYTS